MAAGGGSLLPRARTAAVGLPSGARSGGVPGTPTAVSAPGTVGELSGYARHQPARRRRSWLRRWPTSYTAARSDHLYARVSGEPGRNALKTLRARALVAATLLALSLPAKESGASDGLNQVLDGGGSAGSRQPTARGELWLEPSRFSYPIGNPINVCFTVPAPGRVQLTAVFPDGSSWEMLNEVRADGTYCLNLWPGPTDGRECVRLDLRTTLGPGSRQVCFQAIKR